MAGGGDPASAQVLVIMRVGIGYDSHRFDTKPGPIRIGGVSIPHPSRLLGHSDADVLLHAVADALLGAIGAPDLGELFPPTDPRYLGKDSRWFVQQAQQRIQHEGWQVGNLDTTVVADTPKLSAYKAQMRQTISRLLHVTPAAVSVKAKTTEGLPPGKRGIAAQAVVLLKKARRRGPARAPREERP